MDADPSGSGRFRFSAFSNLGLFVIKGSLALSCGSAALYASTLYSLSNTVNNVMSMLGIKMASRPADLEHPFGYGKELYFWTFIASVFMLGVASMGSISQGIEHIKEQVTATTSVWPMLILLVAFVYECFLFKSALSITRLKKRGESKLVINSQYNILKRSNNPANKMLIWQSGASVAGTGIALGAMLVTHRTDSYLFDGIASIAVGILLGCMALMLADRLKDLIIGRSAGPGTIQLIGDLAMQVPGVTDIREIKTMYVGARSLLVNMEIEIKNCLDVQSAENISDEIERVVKDALNIVTHINIEIIADDMVQDWRRKTVSYADLKSLSEVI
ncbi:cation diffusion facilitator family transporter [Desulfotomaculum arcticum]|uniref:Cation diffusion facilitator family transporter n=1 Tax=Desulfotruncus arcticus DSM 17038 TaxID=1121424 RepID=A0A1I2NUC4_9FIRM|nr:cation diffusion facilitator family transporter [Desulfotruncus arcticus]SFG07575.1 cation diffusion facilitator family transporter [Desulfotomaculum arcticum] [Desulfotruncus arcticus DSM 17038]